MIVKNLLSHFHEFDKNLLRGAILLLDYDGTLSPIVQAPELAVLPADTAALLRSLSKFFKVAVISGRSLINVKKLVGLKGIYYAGNHGLEIDGPGAKLIRHEAKLARPVITEICEKLQEGVRGIKGAIVEDKGLTASVHFRLVKGEGLRRLKSIFRDTVEPFVNTGLVRVTSGKKVFEIRPNVDWNKGKAAVWIINSVDPNGKLVPIYIGDDRTDEDAFLALKKKGITILVTKNPRKSNAKFFLRNVGEVKIFLRKLAN